MSWTEVVRIPERSNRRGGGGGGIVSVTSFRVVKIYIYTLNIESVFMGSWDVMQITPSGISRLLTVISGDQLTLKLYCTPPRFSR